ncbi:hypothetical protein WDV06_11425 [Streptomyces racemochromogenes]|uniref:Uncharacterized protein n=1 Tax=Streptomyces racemochromogenes TaxID=67353 RepID=A0ABW7PBE4_9ACTN
MPASGGDAGGHVDGDLLDGYLAALAARCGPAVFEAVVAAVRDTCAMLAEGHTAVLAGPEGSAFGPVLQREYLSLLAVLMTGRTDLEVITVPTAEGEGWAVVEPDVAADPDTADAVRARVAAAEADRVRALGVLTSVLPPPRRPSP